MVKYNMTDADYDVLEVSSPEHSDLNQSVNFFFPTVAAFRTLQSKVRQAKWPAFRAAVQGLIS